ncbi:MAG: decarboxylating 6-phosphogluconate dehydrogenase [Sporolactobacillus sp.]|jgi:6-phosphogluconate dehydrogenase|nr:decarboxylating 6-phosphogluconate dehydrogenase [Sporolactobacillus sp.]
MDVGMIGLGKMGSHLALNLKRHGHCVYGYDLSKQMREKAINKGISTVESIAELADKMKPLSLIWMMVPAGKATESVFLNLLKVLKPGDIIIDGGNANFHDSIRRHDQANKAKIYFLDVGTSGGISGAKDGACLMIGGDEQAFKQTEPLFKDIAVKDGYLYTGKPGSGHFLKMVHNGIEYSMMQAIGEGFQILKEIDYDYDFASVAKVWNNGSVIRSWLMELCEDAFRKDADLAQIKGVVEATGEARWTVKTALDYEIPVPIIALSLMMRNRSKEEDSFSAKVVAALRNEFGGHKMVKVQD